MTDQLLSKNIMIHTLSPRGVNPHNYKTTSQDLLKVSQSKLLIYFGHGIDTAAFKMAIKASPEIHKCKAYPFDIKPDLDPHTWQSPIEGIKIFETLSECLIKTFPEQKSIIQQNLIKVKKEIQNLFDYYKQQFKALPESDKKILTAHQAFDYLAQDFGLQAFAVMGADSHHEPSAQKIQKLVERIQTEKLKVLFPESDFLPTSLKRLTTLTSIQVGPKLLSDSLPEDSKKAEKYQDFLKYNLEQIYQTLRNF